MEAIEGEFGDCDVLIKAAAPSDFRPDVVSSQKIKKSKDESEMTMNFVKNPDVAAHFGRIKTKQVIVGFAAETNNLVEFAKGKLEEKNLDFIVAIDVTKEGAGFQGNTNIASIIDASGEIVEYPLMSKDELAKIIIDKVAQKLS